MKSIEKSRPLELSAESAVAREPIVGEKGALGLSPKRAEGHARIRAPHSLQAELPLGSSK
jgi:hypothetical protein